MDVKFVIIIFCVFFLALLNIGCSFLSLNKIAKDKQNKSHLKISSLQYLGPFSIYIKAQFVKYC